MRMTGGGVISIDENKIRYIKPGLWTDGNEV